MTKKVIAAVLMLLASGLLVGLDYLNKQELGEAEQMRSSMLQARAEAKKRIAQEAKKLEEEKASVERQTLADLNKCLAVAEKSKSDYMTIIQKISPRKRGQAAIPPAIASDVEKILVAAKTECQQTYDNRVKNGL